MVYNLHTEKIYSNIKYSSHFRPNAASTDQDSLSCSDLNVWVSKSAHNSHRLWFFGIVFNISRLVGLHSVYSSENIVFPVKTRFVQTRQE